jgi:hypothetical protein
MGNSFTSDGGVAFGVVEYGKLAKRSPWTKVENLLGTNIHFKFSLS